MVPAPPPTGNDSSSPALVTATMVSPVVAPVMLVEKPTSFVPTSRSFFAHPVVSQLEIVLVVFSLCEMTRWVLFVKSRTGLNRPAVAVAFVVVAVSKVVGFATIAIGAATMSPVEPSGVDTLALNATVFESAEAATTPTVLRAGPATSPDASVQMLSGPTLLPDDADMAVVDQTKTVEWLMTSVTVVPPAIGAAKTFVSFELTVA